MAIDRNNDLVSAQEKMEWVTPKILLMSAGDTEGNKTPKSYNEGTKKGPS